MKRINLKPFTRRNIFALLVMCIMVSAFGQSGGDYILDWSSIDGGGGQSAGGQFVLTGTIGQPDAGYSSGGNYELFGGYVPVTFPYQTDRFPSDYSTYSDWIALGKPNCWCGISGSPQWPYQCDGDIDNATQGQGPLKFRVYTNDFNLLVANWKKLITDPTLNPCADIDHKPQGLPKYRVYTNDYNILIGNWKKRDIQLPGNCPRQE